MMQYKTTVWCAGRSVATAKDGRQLDIKTAVSENNALVVCYKQQFAFLSGGDSRSSTTPTESGEQCSI